MSAIFLGLCSGDVGNFSPQKLSRRVVRILHWGGGTEAATVHFFLVNDF